MICRNNLILDTLGKKPIVYDVLYKPTRTQKSIVVFCHGYKGFKDWGAWNLVARAFAEAGFFFMKFNFSHNGGTVDQPIDFPDLEAFAQNNFSKELEDLDRMIDHIKNSDRFKEEGSSENISLIGHSRGGGMALIKAEEDSRVKNVITWAGICDFKARFNEDSKEFKEWQKTGITYVENGRTKQQMPHDFQFYSDFKANEDRLTIRRAVNNISIPQLIIHGSEDQTVFKEEASALHSWNPKSRLEIIEAANHVFGSRHPWVENEMPEYLRKVVGLSIEFLK